MGVLMVSSAAASPVDAAPASGSQTVSVSNFLTVQSLTNFAAMTGAISAAWHALRLLGPAGDGVWVPYLLALTWGLVSLALSWDALKGTGRGAIFAAVFIAAINSLVLAGAVVGTSQAVSKQATPTTQGGAK